ncbi:MAG: helix-turn-helix domain-containing protein [Marinifilaceae bacterium]|jgi:transposase-like protein|nr:helix-turn-helix domain-containing protein [Marinifilaceae bacterium]
MKTKKFKKLIQEIDNFNNLEFRLLKEKIEERIHSKKVSYILETPINELKCPFCSNGIFIKWGKRSDLQRYKCKKCNKTFNSLTKTPLAKLRRKGHWLDYSQCLKEGLSIRKAASECKIHKNTAFRWRHRFLTNSRFIKAKKLGGIVENTYLITKESFKGSKNKKNIPRYRKNIFILYGIDRNNNLFDITNKGFSFDSINNGFKDIILDNSLILTDKNVSFKQFAKSNKYKYAFFSERPTKLSSKIKSHRYKYSFLEWINKTFKGVATKYLENYVSWFRGINEFKSGIKAITILYRAKSIEKYRHQPIKMTRFI